MNKDHFLSGKLTQLKGDIQKWLTKWTGDADHDVEQSFRDAEKLILKFQKRYGYLQVRQDREH